MTWKLFTLQKQSINRFLHWNNTSTYYYNILKHSINRFLHWINPCGIPSTNSFIVRHNTMQKMSAPLLLTHSSHFSSQGSQKFLNQSPTTSLHHPSLLSFFHFSFYLPKGPRDLAPILKKLTLVPSSPANCRPTSNLSTMSKLLERLILASLTQLHLFPIHLRIIFKISLITYRTLAASNPPYLNHLIHRRQIPTIHLHQPFHRSSIINRGFTWNDLPPMIWSQPTLELFKGQLKTHLFEIFIKPGTKAPLIYVAGAIAPSSWPLLTLSTTRCCWRDLSGTFESMALHSLGYCLTFLIEFIMWNLETTPPLQLYFLLVFLRALSWDLCFSQPILHLYPTSFVTLKYPSINTQLRQVSSLSYPAVASPINSEICGNAQMSSMIGISLTFFNCYNKKLLLKIFLTISLYFWKCLLITIIMPINYDNNAY